MESERWYRIHFFAAQIALSIYVSVAIMYDSIIKVESNAGVGKLNATVTAGLSALLQYYFLNYKYRLSCKLFRLDLLKDNYSFWLVRYLNFQDKTKSLKTFKFKIYCFQLLSIFSAIFVFVLGCLLTASWSYESSKEYFFNLWFGLAGALILPLVRLGTSLVYIPNKSYRFFFRI
ncbi:hypothetical protein OVS_03055 [Mycoplasma ovis str. Michigan]|uniref:RDD domain-containing protein n=1 Tax=Mycoplasma ovis str. Michigan TaxID=1415773 RepID=A0ABM5P0S1_9MOLU|nr:hypothetical protein [Mycoplasma ovis]AHC40026.1 hypothetical protein OVS_03055 [Mycoplasma ovis str. Michigan]